MNVKEASIINGNRVLLPTGETYERKLVTYDTTLVETEYGRAVPTAHGVVVVEDLEGYAKAVFQGRGALAKALVALETDCISPDARLTEGTPFFVGGFEPVYNTDRDMWRYPGAWLNIDSDIGTVAVFSDDCEEEIYFECTDDLTEARKAVILLCELDKYNPPEYSFGFDEGRFYAHTKLGDFHADISHDEFIACYRAIEVALWTDPLCIGRPISTWPSVYNFDRGLKLLHADI